MKTVDASALDFLERFGKSPDGQLLVGLLRDQVADANMNLRSMEGASLHREQGRAATLDWIVLRLTSRPAARRAVSTVPIPDGLEARF